MALTDMCRRTDAGFRVLGSEIFENQLGVGTVPITKIEQGCDESAKTDHGKENQNDHTKNVH